MCCGARAETRLLLGLLLSAACLSVCPPACLSAQSGEEGMSGSELGSGSGSDDAGGSGSGSDDDAEYGAGSDEPDVDRKYEDDMES